MWRVLVFGKRARVVATSLSNVATGFVLRTSIALAIVGDKRECADGVDVADKEEDACKEDGLEPRAIG